MTATDTGDRSYGFATTGISRIAIKGVLWSLLASLTPTIVSSLVFLFTSRSLGPREFGLVALASAIATIAGALAPVGFGQAIVQRPVIERRHLDSVFWLCFLSSIAFFGILLALTFPIADYFGEPELRQLVPVLGLRIIFDLIGTVPKAILERTMSFGKVAVRTVFASIIGGMICLGALWLGYGLWALALSLLTLSFTSMAGSLLATHWWPRFEFDLRSIRELGQFGSFSSVINLINFLNLDQLLIGGLLGVVPLGLYGFARRIYQILTDSIAGPLNSVSFPLLSSLQGDMERRSDAFLFATFLSALISFPVFAGLAVVADDFVGLIFGSHWTGAVFALQCFSAIGLLASIGVLQSSLINAHGKAGVWLVYLLIKQGVTLAYVLLFSSMGLDALMVSLVAVNYAMWVPTLFIAARILKLPLLHYVGSFGVPAMATVAMVVAVEAVHLVTTDWPAVQRLVVEVTVGAALYAGLVLLLARDQLARVLDIVLKRGKY